MLLLKRGLDIDLLKLLYIFFIFLQCGCSQKSINTDIYFVKSPEWVTNATDSDDFYTIGVTDKNASLTTAFFYAKKNAIDNLKVNIFVKLEDIFFNETENISSVEKKTDLWSKIDKKIADNITNSYLNSVIRFDDIWRSPDSEMLYVRFFPDRVSIVNKVAYLLDELKSEYKNNDELIGVIENIKNNVIDGGLKTRTDAKNMISKKNDVSASNGYCKRNIKIKKNKNNIISGNSDFDLRIRKMIDAKNSNE